MSSAVIGALRVTLGMDSAAFTEGLSQAQKQLKDAGSRLQSIGSKMQGIGAGLSAAITAPLIGLGALAVGEASEMRDAVGQVGAALKSMGDVGGRSMDQLKAQADTLAGSSLFEDDEILRGVTANLLTFGNIAGEQFDRAQQAAVNLATRLGTDLQSATILVGKALNDPVKGMAALGRAGVQLSDDQKALVRNLVSTGDAAGAQKVLLGELEKQFAGSAQAARDNAPPLERVRLAFAGMAGDIGTILLPVIDKFAGLLEGLAAKFGQMSPAMQQFAVVGGVVAAAIGPVLLALGSLVAIAGSIATAFAAGGGLAFLLPFLAPIALGVGAIVAAFVLFGDDIIPIVKEFGKQVADVMGPKIMPLFEAVKGAVMAFGEVVASIFAGSGGSASENFKVWGAVVAQVLGAAADIVTGAVNVITNVLKALGALMRGDFSAMWGFLGSAAMSAVRGIGNAFETLFPGVISSVSRMVTGVRDWLVTRFASMVVEPVRQKIEAVKGFFFGLYDAVVGHSYIPDMVEGVAAWMGKLDAGMVVPARNATEQAKQAFQDLRDDVAAIMEGLLTDAERNAREVAAKIAKIRALAAQGGMSQGEARTAEAGVWGENLQPGSRPQIDQGQDMVDPRAREALTELAATASQVGGLMSEAMAGVDAAVNDLASGLVDLALTGEGSLKDLLKSFVKTIAQIIIQMMALKAVELLTGIPISKMLGGGSGGGGGFSFSNLFGGRDGGLKLPGFARGGGFNVAGSGTTDSKIVAFRATPGERVDISTPRQQRQQGGGAAIVHVAPSRYFDAHVQHVVSPMIGAAAVQAAKAGSGMAQSEMYQTARFSRGR